MTILQIARRPSVAGASLQTGPSSVRALSHPFVKIFISFVAKRHETCYLDSTLDQDSFCNCQVRTKLNFKSSIQSFQNKFLFLVLSIQKCIALVYFLKTD